MNIKYTFFGLLLVISSIIKVSAQTDSSKQASNEPKLIVGIVIDHLRSDYFNKYSHLFSDGGFNKILQNGAFSSNTQYNYQYSQTGVDHATIFTGTPPAYHGIISHAWFDRISESAEASTYDKNYRKLGILDTVASKSPHKLLAPTLGDIMKLNNPNSRVIGVSLNNESAIYSAGHSADAAYWLDGVQGKFISSSYYQDTLFNWVNNFNATDLPNKYLSKPWVPKILEDNGNSTDIIKAKLKLTDHFYCDLKKDKKKIGYHALKNYPAGNLLVKDFAATTIINENLGKDDNCDLITINFSCLGNNHRKFSPYSDEMLDCITRLDQNIADLITFLDEQVGMENVLLFITSDQAAGFLPEDLEKQRIPNGYFSSYNAIALLKSYFNVIYGAGSWISGYDSQQIFLNRKLIEDKKLVLEDVQIKAAKFLVQFSGVSKAIPAHNFIETNYSHGVMNKIQRSFNHKRSGDVIIALEPGWVNQIKDERDLVAQYSQSRRVPLFFYGWKIKNQELNQQLDIEDIVPTLSTFLKITPPSGCMGNPIKGLVD
ncbi:alkaline phosphatase family protein [Ancylomarina sp.]|uniref:alkaline phosphatase family protein n=1 Tax=Ancylomarina sp. TaxID=1970196 RepID=UPI003563C199